MKKTFLFGMMMMTMATTALAGNGQVGSAGEPQTGYVNQSIDSACQDKMAQPFLDEALKRKIQVLEQSLSEKGIHIVKVITTPSATTAKILRVPGTEVQARQSGTLQLVSDEGVVFDVIWNGQYLNPNGQYEGGFDYVHAMMMYFEPENDYDTSGRITKSKCFLYDKTDAGIVKNHQTGYEVDSVGF